ncbi:porin [Variovorax sp. PAMC26660]|uniref:porin n=1 Tax=Variovorax sp. PAMC26660 TaxID=2762322 RepID=UPI00164EB52A|nr:porin [Variovorax sp. PAMC26660]QNK65112.1 porin [Variovorax sp. PAMC26660]
MKKSLVALAALAVAGVASAQSSVTLFGVVDASISNYSTKSTWQPATPFAIQPFAVPAGRKQSQTSLANSGYNSSRLGFRGTEDLGGGLAASFWLESGISNDDGAKGINNFNRRSTVSLSGGFGEVRLGRDYTPTFWNDTVFDPFGTNGVGTNLISNVNTRLASSAGPGSAVAASDNYVRTGNSIGYFLPPNLGGFYGQFQYALHENVKLSDTTSSPSSKGRYVGGRFGYANGPLDVAASYGQSTAADSASLTASQNRKINTFNLGASYDFGPVKLFGEYSAVKDKNQLGTPVALLGLPYLATTTQSDKYNGYLLGVTVPVGAGLIRASYSSVKYKNGAPQTFNFFNTNNGNARGNQLAIGYVHNLSKRTALYATLSRINLKNAYNNPAVMGATTGGSPAYLAGGGYAPKSATGYDFGIRHAF